MRKIYIILYIIIISLVSSLVSAWYEPVHYWEFEADPTDTMNNTGLNDNGGVTYPIGLIGNGVDLEADSSQYIRNATLNPIASVQTYDFWIKPETVAESKLFTISDVESGATDITVVKFESNGVIEIETQSGDQITGTIPIGTGAWTHIVIVEQGTFELYINGTLDVNGGSSSGMEDDYFFNIGRHFPGGNYFDGMIDNFAMFTDPYTSDNATASYNSGVGIDFLAVFIAPPNNITISLETPATNTLKYGTTNFTYNVSAIETTLNNCSLLFNNTVITTETTIINNTIHTFSNIPTTNYNTIDWGVICRAANDDTLTTENYTLLPGTLKISAYSLITGDSIDVFDISVDGILDDSTSIGNYTLGNLTGGTTLNITLNALGYELKSILYNVTSVQDFYNFSLYDTNSLNITIYDETTGVQMSQNVTMVFTSLTSAFTNVSEDGKFYYSDLAAEEFQAVFFSSGYSNRTYILTVGDRTHQNINIYLASGSSSTLFVITDSNTEVTLSDVFIQTYKFITDDWVTVESKYSDITGRVKINYVEETNYRFFLSKDGYDDLIFNLNPILFSSYKIQMEQSTLLNYSFNLDEIAIVYGPHTFNNTQVTNFTFLINSPYGSLTNYGIDLTYPGGSQSLSGSNAIGGVLTTLINISNATVFDTVKLKYYYITTVAGRRNFTDQFPITFPDGTGSNTFMANKSKTFGLGIFERILIATLIAIFIVGIASLVGQPLPGFGLNLLIQSYLTYIGFIPIWITLPSLLLGMMILIWKSGGT